MINLITRPHPLGFTTVDLEASQFEYPRTAELKQYLVQFLETNAPYLALNMANVNFLDSFGLAVIISVMKLCKEAGGQCMIYGLSEAVERLINLTHMDRVLEIWTTEGQVAYRMKEVLQDAQKKSGVKADSTLN